MFNPAPLGKPLVCHVRLAASSTALILGSLALMGWLASPLATAADPQFEEVSTGLPAGNYAGLAMADLDGDGRAELLAGRRPRTSAATEEKAEGLHLFTYKDSKWILQEISTAGEYYPLQRQVGGKPLGRRLMPCWEGFGAVKGVVGAGKPPRWLGPAGCDRKSKFYQ